jgi:hypothetical protein
MTAIIQSIQPFAITISTGTTGGTAAITAVNTSNSVIFPGGCRGNAGSANQWERVHTQLQLTSSVLVSAVRDTAFATTAFANGTVVEFANFVNSIQTGVITVTTATTGGTASINSVSTRAFIIHQGMSIAAQSCKSRAFSGVSLVNSTQVAAVVAPCSVPIRVQYAVVDLTSDVVDTVQHIDLEVATTTTVDTATITSVDPGLTLIVSGGIVSTSAATTAESPVAMGYITELPGATSVEFVRASSLIAVSRRHFASVVQFKSQALASTVKRGAILMTTALGVTATATIAAVSTRAFVHADFFQGRMTTGTAGGNSGAASFVLASTLVTATRHATLHALTVRYEVAEWQTSIALAPASTSVGSGLVYGNLLSGHVRSPVNRANYIMQGSV